jgi:hypothetical protein
VFDALTEMQRGGEVKPRLATKWVISKDLTERTFTLREGVKYFDKAGPKSYDDKPVGTGPSPLVRGVKDDRTELQANPGYWKGASAIKTAVIRPNPSEASRPPPCSPAKSTSSLPCRRPAAPAPRLARAEGRHGAGLSRDLPHLQRQPGTAAQSEAARGHRLRDRP